MGLANTQLSSPTGAARSPTQQGKISPLKSAFGLAAASKGTPVPPSPSCRPRLEFPKPTAEQRWGLMSPWCWVAGALPGDTGALRIPLHLLCEHGRTRGLLPDYAPRRGSTIAIVLLTRGGSWCSAAGSLVLLFLQLFGTDPVWPF